jgi:hypothetical protein
MGKYLDQIKLTSTIAYVEATQGPDGGLRIFPLVPLKTADKKLVNTLNCKIVVGFKMKAGTYKLIDLIG